MKRKPESVPLRMRHVGNGLIPATGFAERRLNEIPPDTEVEITIRRRRSLVHHNFYWAVLDAVIASGSSSKYPTPYKLHQALLSALGYTTELIHLNGTVQVIPDSTAFQAMDQTSFGTYYSHAMELLARLLGTDPVALVKEAAA